MKTRPLTAADRDKLEKQFPAVYRVVLAAEVLRDANAEHNDAILANQWGKKMDNAEEAEARAVDGVSMMVKIMQEGA